MYELSFTWKIRARFTSQNLFDSSTEWLYKSFFPQEDKEQLMACRSQLTPFLKLIMKALDGSGNQSETERKSLCDEIIREARTLTTSPIPASLQSSSNSNTLQMEHNLLKLNLT